MNYRVIKHGNKYKVQGKKLLGWADMGRHGRPYQDFHITWYDSLDKAKEAITNAQTRALEKDVFVYESTD